MLEGSTGNGLGIYVTAHYDGKAPVLPNTVVFAITVMGSNRSLEYDYEFILLINGERHKFGELIRPRLDYSSGTFFETTALQMSVDTLKRIANAQTVEGKIGPKEFTIRPEVQNVLKTLLAHFEKRP